MEYVVKQDYYNDEFDFELYEGEFVCDGDIEPDLMANLTASGVVEAIKPKKTKRKE